MIKLYYIIQPQFQDSNSKPLIKLGESMGVNESSYSSLTRKIIEFDSELVESSRDQVRSNSLSS